MDGNNQPPMPQPMAPQPMQPAPQPPVGGPAMDPYQMPPKKGLSKGALWGIIGGVIGLIVVIVGVVLAVVLMAGPSKQDYSKAGEAVDSIVNSYHEISSKEITMMSPSGTDTSRKNAKDDVQGALDNINAKIDELEKMKAVTGDKDVKEKFDALVGQREKFNKLIELEIEMADKLMPVLTKISSLSPSSATLTEIDTLIKELENISLKDSDTNDLIAAMTAYMKVAREYKEYVSSGRYDDSSIFTRYSRESSKFYDAMTDWKSNVEKKQKEGQIKDQVNALRSTIDNKLIGR